MNRVLNITSFGRNCYLSLSVTSPSDEIQTTYDKDSSNNADDERNQLISSRGTNTSIDNTDSSRTKVLGIGTNLPK